MLKMRNLTVYRFFKTLNSNSSDQWVMVFILISILEYIAPSQLKVYINVTMFNLWTLLPKKH